MDLVKNRRTYLEDGYACITTKDLVAIVSMRFRLNMASAMAVSLGLISEKGFLARIQAFGVNPRRRSLIAIAESDDETRLYGEGIQSTKRERCDAGYGRRGYFCVRMPK